MRNSELFNIDIIPNKTDNSLFELRENGINHTPYEKEVLFYNYIQNGSIEGVTLALESMLKDGLVVGSLSLDTLRQTQYWAVSCITLATRHAINGGLDETDAFCLSDSSIRQIDAMTTSSEIVKFISKNAIALTELVHNCKNKRSYHFSVKKCINFVNKNLHNKISLSMLSEECHLSCDYLSVIFKKDTGKTISAYIMEQKLLAAKPMLMSNNSISSVSYCLSFSSESHFITCFKKHFGITPKEYVKLGKMTNNY